MLSKRNLLNLTFPGEDPARIPGGFVSWFALFMNLRAGLKVIRFSLQDCGACCFWAWSSRARVCE